MSANAMNKAAMRGFRRGMRIQSGDLTSVRRMRQEIEARDFVAEAWSSVGESLYTAMGQMPTKSQTTSSPSSRMPRSSR